MNTRERTVHMANQIARNFVAQDHDAIAKATADHIAKFWDPRMKSVIFEHLEAGGDGLIGPAKRAIEIVRDTGAPAPQTRATEYGAGRSDAG